MIFGSNPEILTWHSQRHSLEDKILLLFLNSFILFHVSNAKLPGQTKLSHKHVQLDNVKIAMSEFKKEKKRKKKKGKKKKKQIEK